MGRPGPGYGVGSVLYVWHNETLQRSAAAQATVIAQQAARLQQYEAALRQLQDGVK